MSTKRRVKGGGENRAESRFRCRWSGVQKEKIGREDSSLHTNSFTTSLLQHRTNEKQGGRQIASTSSRRATYRVRMKQAVVGDSGRGERKAVSRASDLRLVIMFLYFPLSLFLMSNLEHSSFLRGGTCKGGSLLQLILVQQKQATNDQHCA
jgi:hypothetical protein